jgi:hypothetical protein
MRRLNGWQRIGVVLTSLWLLFAALTIAFAYTDNASDFVSVSDGTPAVCSGASDPSGHTITLEEAYGGCAPGKEISPAIPSSKHLRLAPAGALLLLPPLFGWLLVYVAVAAVRWVARGFHGDAT